MEILILVDANGQYKNGQHIQMYTVDENFYTKILNAVRTKKYSKIIYYPNTPGIKTQEEFQEALAVDPIWSHLTPEEKKDFIVFPHGLGCSLEEVEEYVKLENFYADVGANIEIGGLYEDWCVKTHCDHIRSRRPNANIRINYDLVRESPQKAAQRNRERIL